MEEYSIVLFGTLFFILFFTLEYLLENVRLKQITGDNPNENLEENAKKFYISTDLIAIMTTLVMINAEFFYIYIYMAMFIAVCYLLDSIKCLKSVVKKENSIRFFIEKIFLTILMFLVPVFMSLFITATGSTYDKPVIYIYPEVETKVEIKVAYPEKLSCSYPEHNDGWEVIAQPNGDLVDVNTGRNLYCLYWEGNAKTEYKFKDGFVVAGENSAKFLEEKLAILGLNEREANEFIIYWLPKLEANKYNLIRFETVEEIDKYMPLTIEPKPDTLIRISMNFKGLNKPIEIEEQKLEMPLRTGYTIVEWGGSEF